MQDARLVTRRLGPRKLQLGRTVHRHVRGRHAQRRVRRTVFAEPRVEQPKADAEAFRGQGLPLQEVPLHPHAVRIPVPHRNRTGRDGEPAHGGVPLPAWIYVADRLAFLRVGTFLDHASVTAVDGRETLGGGIERQESVLRQDERAPFCVASLHRPVRDAPVHEHGHARGPFHLHAVGVTLFKGHVPHRSRSDLADDVLCQPVLAHDLAQAARLVDRHEDARFGVVGVAVVTVRHQRMAVHDLAGDVVV